jgi:hypothetical protein
MSDIQDSYHSSDNKIHQFYYKMIYIERGMLIGSFCSHTLDTTKCKRRTRTQQSTNKEQEDMVRRRKILTLRSDRPKYQLGYHNLKYLA